MNVKTKNVLSHVGNILVINPQLIFDNILVLANYGIKLTNDNNNNGYTLLGMTNLADRLDYLIENNLWHRDENIDLDTIDLLRGLVIKDGYTRYLDCKKKGFYGKIDIASSEEEEFDDKKYDEVRIEKVFEDHNYVKNIIDKLDSEYLTENGVYSIGVNTLSRQRVLRNICNYKGKGNDEEMFEAVLRHKASVPNIDEMINYLMPLLEMGEKGVKLS